MEFINYEVEGMVGIITINRPKALNALNSQVLTELDETLDNVDINAIRALILTGAGEKSFVAGADIGEMSTLTKAEGEAFGKKVMMYSENLKHSLSLLLQPLMVLHLVEDVRFQ